jgi:hypothetical protein
MHYRTSFVVGKGEKLADNLVIVVEGLGHLVSVPWRTNN